MEYRSRDNRSLQRQGRLVGVIMALMALAGCGAAESSADPRIIARLEVRPGELHQIEVLADEPISVGVACRPPLEGATVTLKQANSISSAATSTWVSRKWMPADGELVLEMSTNAAGPAPVIVFVGEAPPG